MDFFLNSHEKYFMKPRTNNSREISTCFYLQCRVVGGVMGDEEVQAPGMEVPSGFQRHSPDGHLGREAPRSLFDASFEALFGDISSSRIVHIRRLIYFCRKLQHYFGVAKS